MDKPLCKICDTKHWPSEDHKFGRTDAVATTEATVETQVAVSRKVGPDKPAGQSRGAPENATEPPKSDTGLQLIPGKPCPTCGKRVGRSGAERMRRHRAKARE